MLQNKRKITIVITTLYRMVICERMDDYKMYDTATSRRNGAYVLKSKNTHIRREAHGRITVALFLQRRHLDSTGARL